MSAFIAIEYEQYRNGYRMGYSDLLQNEFCHVLHFRSMQGQGIRFFSVRKFANNDYYESR